VHNRADRQAGTDEKKIKAISSHAAQLYSFLRICSRSSTVMVICSRLTYSRLVAYRLVSWSNRLST
jgi:hypothetical protein